MRVMIFFDLPVVKKIDRKVYSKFRRFLLNDGYDMLQFSVYSRLCNGPDMANKHIARLKDHIPSKGSIRCLVVTEKQYGEMKFLVGKATVNERRVNAEQLSLF